MKVLLMLLVLVPLLVPPVFSITGYEKFKKQHVRYINDHSRWQCNDDMNNILMDLRTNCKDCNSYILLGDRRNTNLNDVKKVCLPGHYTHAGFNHVGALYKSIRQFYVVDCEWKSGSWPPNCRYEQSNPQYKKIIVGCSQGYPVHFQKSC